MAFQDTGLESTWFKAKSIVEVQGNNALFIELSQQVTAKLPALKATATSLAASW